MDPNNNPANVFCKLEYHRQNKLRQWLWRRHGKPAGQYKRYPNERLRQRRG